MCLVLISGKNLAQGFNKLDLVNIEGHRGHRIFSKHNISSLPLTSIAKGFPDHLITEPKPPELAPLPWEPFFAADPAEDPPIAHHSFVVGMFWL